MAKVDATVELYYSGAWQTAAAYTRDPIVITRGRPDEVSMTPPSTLSLTLDNRSGDYSPRDPNSALFRLIGRNTPIRVTVGSSVRFVGEVESWPQRFSVDGNDAWVPLTANGIMRRLNAPGTSAPARSAMRRAIDGAATAPVAYWALDAGRLATAGLLTTGSGGSMTISSLTGQTAFGAAELAPWLEQGVSIDAGVTMTGAVDGMSAAPTTVAFDWIRQATEGQTLVDITGVHANAGMRWQLYFTAGAFNDIEFFVYNNGTQVDSDSSLGQPQYFDASSHHIRIAATQNGANVDWTVYLDGTSLLTGTIASVTLSAVKQVQVSQAASGTSTGPVVIGHFAVWQTALAIADAADAADGWQGETAADRITRLCTEDGITATIVGTAADTEAMGPQRLVPFMDLIRDAADADGGILYEPRDSLGLAYRTRVDLYNQAAALALDFASGGEVAPPLAPVEDTDATANDVTVTRYLGSFGRAVQETGPLNVAEPTADADGVGRYRKDVTLVLNTDGQAQHAAQWLKGLGTWDEARLPVVMLDLTAMAADGLTTLAADALALDCGDRFTIASPPAGLPPDTILQHAQGFAETIGSHRHTIAVNATPAGPYEVFVVETGSDNRSRIPSGRGSTLTTEVLDATETGVDIASDRAAWTTDAAQCPFDVLVDGERMRVTAVAGAGLTQTLTVVRSINGVRKTHASGVEVQLFRPPVVAR